MKFNQHNKTGNETIVVGGGKEMSFSIDTDSSVIFDILRDKMYSNKIGSVVREVASNSRDANREAGNSNKSIQIIISDSYSELLPEQTCIIFKDKGIGISEDRMENVFIKYASSTKRYTNAQTGGFGLGAKTPFAYTDSFYIHTVALYREPIVEIQEMEIDDEVKEVEVVVGHKEAVKKSYLYNGLTDDSGKGKMILLEEEEVEMSTETGTSVIIPIKDGDIDKFKNEVRFYTSLWGGVEYIGSLSGIQSDEVTFDCETYMITNSSNWNSIYKTGIYALVDGIPYPLSTSIEGLGDLHQLYINLENETVFLKFNTGEVTVSATRENIEYSEKTIEAVKRILKRSVTQMKKEYSSEVNKLSMFELAKHLNTTFRQKSLFDKHDDPLSGKSPKGTMLALKASGFFNPLTEVKYKGVTLQEMLFETRETLFNFESAGFQAHLINSSDPSNYSIKTGSNLLRYIDCPIYLMDAKKDRRRNLTALEGHGKFLLLKGQNIDGTLTKKQADFLLEVQNRLNIEYKLYSEVEKAETEPSSNTYVQLPTVSVPVRKFTRYIYEDGGTPLRVEVDRKTKSSELKVEKAFFYLIDSLTDYKLRGISRHDIPEDYTLYVTSKKLYERHFEGVVNPNIVYRDNGVETRNLNKLFKCMNEVNTLKGIDSKDLVKFKENREAVKELYKAFGIYRLSDHILSDSRRSMSFKSFLFPALVDKKVNTFVKAKSGVSVTKELVELIYRYSSEYESLIGNNNNYNRRSHKVLDNYFKSLPTLFFETIRNINIANVVVMKSEEDFKLDIEKINALK